MFFSTPPAPNTVNQKIFSTLLASSRIVVFVDTETGTGHYSAQWERRFWAWWAANGMEAHQFLDAAGVEAQAAPRPEGSRRPALARSGWGRSTLC